MNRYPLWKYVIIAVAMIVSTIYTLPNFFGEAPALQVSPVRATLKADIALQTRASEALTAANIAPVGSVLDGGSLRLRFADTDIQLRAKDIVEKAVGDGYIVALNLVSNSPSWLTSLRALPMYLGLDLRGGVHFLLQIDMKAALNKKVEGYVNELRTTLREQKLASAGITREGMNVVVRFRDAASREKASVAITKASPDLSLREVEEGGEFRLVASVRPEALKRSQEFALQQNVTTLRNRVNELGVAEPVIQQQGADRIVVQLPGVQDTAKAKELLGRTAALEVRMVAEDLSDVSSLQAGAAGNPPFGTEYFTERNGATRIVPGSHVFDHAPEYGTHHDTVAAEMPAGSVMLFDSALWHGGGANATQARRYALSCSYCAGWMRQQENYQLGVPRETAARFPRRLQELCGYSVYRGQFGHIDNADPIELLGQPRGKRMVWEATDARRTKAGT